MPVPGCPSGDRPIARLALGRVRCSGRQSQFAPSSARHAFSRLYVSEPDVVSADARSRSFSAAASNGGSACDVRFFESISAATAETIGAEAEVPLKSAMKLSRLAPSPSTDRRKVTIAVPGAMIERDFPALLAQDESGSQSDSTLVLSPP